MCSTGLATTVLATPAIAPEAYSSAESRQYLCYTPQDQSRTQAEGLSRSLALAEEPLGPFQRAELY